MLNKVGGGRCYTKWSRAQKIANSLFHTDLYADRKEASNSFSDLDFVSKYNKETTDQILNVLNETSGDELARYDISMGRSRKIEKYRKINGPFKTIEQVLEVDDFGKKVLEKLVVSIADGSGKRQTGAEFKLTPKLLNDITAPLLENDRRSRIGTVTSISVGLKHISWAKLDSGGRLLSWESYNDFDWPRKDNPMLLHDLALTIRKKLPLSDVYVTEGASAPQATAIQQNAPSFFNIQRLQLTSMLVTLLATEFNDSNEDNAARWRSVNNFFFLRRQITAQLFQLVVGNEIVSARAMINQIIDNTISDSLAHIPPLTIDFREIDAYDKSDALKKEALGQAFLFSAAFIILAVEQNILSLKSLRGGKWQKNRN